MTHVLLVASLLLAATGQKSGTQTVVDPRFSIPDVDGTTSSKATSVRLKNLVDHTSGWVNVRSYGAKGDGTTDDYPAFLDAVKAIGAKGGGTLLVPEGTFALSKAVPLINGLRILGTGYGSRLKAVGTFGVIGEAYPSRFCELNGWTGTSRFNQQYDATIAGYQNTDGSVTNVTVENLRIDGNKASVAFNTFNAGSADDAYQNLIRLDRVQSSRFVRLWLENAVFNAISNYDASDDNVWSQIVVTAPGKPGIAGNLSGSGIYLEASNARVRFEDITITSPAQYGILVKAATGGLTTDCQFRGVTVIGAPLDGIRVGDDGDTNGVVQRTTIEQAHVLNSGTSAGYVGIRVAHSGSTVTGYVKDTILTNVQVSGGGNSGGIVITGNTTGYVQRTIVAGATVSGVTGTGFRVLATQTEDTTLSSVVSTGNGGDYQNTATRTRIAGAVLSGSSTYDFMTTPRVTAGSATAPEFQWNRDSVGSWSAGVASPNAWYLYGLGGNQIMVDASGTHVATALLAPAATITGTATAGVVKTSYTSLEGQAYKSITSTPSTLYTAAAGGDGVLVFVSADNGTNGFFDLVVFGNTGAAKVVPTITWYGTPPTTTYAASGLNLQASVNTGTYRFRYSVLRNIYN